MVGHARMQINFLRGWLVSRDNCVYQEIRGLNSVYELCEFKKLNFPGSGPPPPFGSAHVMWIFKKYIVLALQKKKPKAYILFLQT